MKRLFILANIYENSTTIGITKKVHQQIDAFRRLGFDDIVYSGYLDDGAAIFDNEGNVIKFRKFRFKNNKLKELTKNYTLKRLCTAYMLECDIFDLIYSRYLFFDPLFLNFLKKASRKTGDIVLEAHCYPVYEKGNYTYYPVYFIDRLYIRLSMQYVKLVAAISDIKNIWNKETVSFDNAIVLSDYKKKTQLKKDTIDLIFVGYEYRVHGVDRILFGLYEYYKSDKNKNKVILHLVGRFMDSTVDLVDKLNLSEYVNFEGLKFGEELDHIFDISDIAISVLAPHRKGSNLGTGLKSKEYIARGIPFIMAGKSISIPSDWPYVYRIGLNDGPVDISAVLDFYKDLQKHDKNISDTMRKYAETITWDHEMKKILDKLKEL